MWLLRFAGEDLSAVYDWDSLRIVREPVLVGSVAHAFTANWQVRDRPQFPTLEEALGFISDYKQARAIEFAPEEHSMILAALVYTMAYTARCEHSDARTHMGRHAPQTHGPSQPPTGSARAFLHDHGHQLLNRATG